MTEIRILVNNSIIGDNLVWHHKKKQVFWLDKNDNSIHSYSPKKSQLKKYKVNNLFGALNFCTSGNAIFRTTKGVVGTKQGFGIWSYDEHITKQHLFDKSFSNYFISAFSNCKNDLMLLALKSHHQNNQNISYGGIFILNQQGEIASFIQDVFADYLAFDKERNILYCVNSQKNNIISYTIDFKRFCAVQKKIILEAYTPGDAGGISIDAKGYLWHCRRNANQIIRISPTGKITNKIQLPVTSPSDCAFGGNQLQSLYIISETYLDSNDRAANALEGSLLEFRPEVEGMKQEYFFKKF